MQGRNVPLKTPVDDEGGKCFESLSSATRREEWTNHSLCHLSRLQLQLQRQRLCKRLKVTMSSSTKLPPIQDVPSLPAEDRAAILDLLFEPSTQLHTLSLPLLHDKTFSSYIDLIAAVGVQLTDLSESASTSDTTWLHDILGSHPRLGAKKVDSAQSQAEQAQLQGGGDEAAKLTQLNDEYEQKFPGLKYVVFVQGRSREVIMEDMRKRIAESDMASEQATTIRVSTSRVFIHVSSIDVWQAMCEIAVDRATKLLI